MTSPENPIETAAIETHEEEEDVLEGEEEEEELEALEDERLEQNEHHCAICQEKFKDPKILTCLHVFCRECVEKQLAENRAKAEEENDGQQEGEEGSGRPSTEGEQAPVYIECKICKDITRLPKNGIDDLQTEYVMAAILDMSSIADLTIVCTSCKAKEKATARCNDCVSFLCPNCVTAHQFMRCFENHKVVSFADLHKNGGVIHKPIFCPVHPTESLKCYCNTCQVAVCGECILTDHQTADHHCEKISDIDKKTIEEVLELVGKARNLGEGLHETSSNLQVTLADLQLHKESAIGLIRETFHSYKAMLEKKKDEMLENVEEMHKGLELALLDKMHNTAVTQEKIEDACKFANRTATLGEPVHVMMQKKLILKRLETLMKSLPKHEMNCSIEFQTSAESFEECLDKCFGHLVKNDDDDDDDKDSKADTQHSSLHSSFDHDFNYAAMVSSENVGLTPVSAELASLNTLNPNTLSMSIAGSMSFCQAPPPIGSPIMGSMTLGDGSVSRNSISPAMSDSGISVDNSSTNSNNSATMFNVAVMANMAKFPHGADALAGINGQMSGLNLGLPTSSAPGARTLAPMCQAESGLLQTPSTISSSQRTQNANLENLAATLLNQGMNQGNLNLANLNLANIGSLTGLSALDGLGNMNMGASDLPGNSDPTMGARPIFGTQSDSAADFMSLGASSGLPSPGGSSNFSTGSGGNGGSFPTVRRGNKMTAMQIKFKFGQLGPGKQQFNSPHGFCLGVEEDIIVADTNNHRIQVFEKSGEFKFQFGIPGREEGQLWYPRKVAVMRSSGKYVVCDRGNERSRMQIFTKSGHFMKKIAIRYIDIVAGLAITPNGHIVAVDSVSPTVFCISESGDLIKWFDCSDYMREPSDIAINGKEYFVCDFKGHCVVVFSEEGQFLRRIGCENITNYPNGIDISDAGDVLVGDSHGNRFHVAVFQRDGSLIGEFQCPYVKVSRCCGLKISSEGYIITLAKNNHHVLVLDTLYIS